MSKESFKAFARLHPELATYVLKGNATWQQFFEIYEIYGENNTVWNNYINNSKLSENNGFKDILNTLKSIDMDSVQQGINNLKKTVSLLQDLGSSNSARLNEPQPLYKKFDD